MVDRQISDSNTVIIYLDGIPILNATETSVDRQKSIDRTSVIGTRDYRISEGSVEYSGSLTILKENEIGTRLIHTKDANSIDIQNKVWDGAQDDPIGIGAVQQTLNSGNLTTSQTITALGNRIDTIYLLVARTNTFTGDLTVTVNGNSFVIPNDKIPNTKGWITYTIPLAERITVVKGTQYSVDFTIPSGPGNLDFYGADVQDYVLVGTGDGVTTAFDLLHSTVDSGSIFVRKNLNQYLGQLEGFSFSDGTGTAGVDQIVFGTAPANGVEVYAKYEYDDNDLIAWRIGFTNATNPVYTMKFEYRDEDGKLLDTSTITDVRFSNSGVTVNPGAFIENSLTWEGRVEQNYN